MIKLKSIHFLLGTALVSSIFIVLQSDAAFHWTLLGDAYTSQPDLFVQSTDVQPDHYNQAGGASKLVVTVRNDGTTASAPTQLSIHGSFDGTCRSSRNQFKTYVVPPLSPKTSDTYNIVDPASASDLYTEASQADPTGQSVPRTSQFKLHLCTFLAGDDTAYAADHFLGIRADDLTYFPWDVNRDNFVTPEDAIYVVNRIGGNNALADLNGDGAVTSQDTFDVIGRLGYTVNQSVND